MLRLRRYRVFIVFAIAALGLFYHFHALDYAPNPIAESFSSLRHQTGVGKTHGSQEPPPSAGNSDDRFNDSAASSAHSKKQLQASATSIHAQATTPKSLDTSQEPPAHFNHDSFPSEALDTSLNRLNEVSVSRLASRIQEISRATPQAVSVPSPIFKTSQIPAPPSKPSGATRIAVQEYSQVRTPVHSVQAASNTILPQIHWSSLVEHFPIPTKQLISLPTGQAVPLPKIQHDFGPVSSRDQAKLEAIKEAFLHSWNGYRDKAWMQDELSPVSGESRNPFCGWGATLVDSLDTLWLMDLKDEFEAAVDAVQDIDFTMSTRNDIPLFETVIRYLGGLIGAYDISGGKYELLLEKAVELAQMLMGAFDTPNRMPMTFYLWKPSFASQPHRAKTRVVMAELGSLSLEFTRLAQITKDAKYYDAIARITNEFALWQNKTRLPGLWPLRVDASGCKKPPSHDVSTDVANPPSPKVSQASIAVNVDLPSRVRDLQTRTQKAINPTASGVKIDIKSTSASSFDREDDNTATYSPRRRVEKRHELDEHSQEDPTVNVSSPKCVAQGLASPPYSKIEEFSLGGLADSTYEYLPKEFVLLEGLESKYRSMYELAVETATKHLLYRPMIPDQTRSVLQLGLLKIEGGDDLTSKSYFHAEGTHLTCFAGGMYALGSKVFERDKDLEIARKLTDGCIWAYEATTTGIMPEVFSTIPCKEREHCVWNQTLWLQTTRPGRPLRVSPESNFPDQQVLLKTENSEDRVARGQRNDLDLGDPSLESSPSLSTKVVKTAAQDDLSGPVGQNDAPKSLSEKRSRTVGDDQIIPGPRSNDFSHDDEPSTTFQAKRQHQISQGLLETRQLGEQRESSLSGKNASTEAASRTDKPYGMKQEGDSELDQSLSNSDETDSSENEVAPKLKAGLVDSTLTVEENILRSKPSPKSPKASSVSMKDGYIRPPNPSRTSPTEDDAKQQEVPRGMTKVSSPRYLLRPEAVESVFIMYRITGDEYWRSKGWKMYKAIAKYTNSAFGASAISDVNAEEPELLDEMESFWLAETLKYFYLLFSDSSVLSLDDYVYNTEAHPFKRTMASSQ